MTLRPLLVFLLLTANSCVVSTYGGTGTPPDVPLPPEPTTKASTGPELEKGWARSNHRQSHPHLLQGRDASCALRRQDQRRSKAIC